ncbi:hypothetical protein BH11BAC2_BH11BAC2_09800 [soil metagenome]
MSTKGVKVITYDHNHKIQEVILAILHLIKKTTMKTLSILTSIIIAMAMTSCGGSSDKPAEEPTTQETSSPTTNDPSSYDPKRGEGKFTEEMLSLTDKIDEAKAKTGENLASVKCTSCHKVTEEKLVGPGWKGVTSRRTPVWIMNFITNPDPMINKDPQAQAMLEICLVRMPNQNLADDEARSILEYMRKNDGLK